MLIALTSDIAVDPETVVTVALDEAAGRVQVHYTDARTLTITPAEGHTARELFISVVKEINDACLKILEERRSLCCPCSFTRGTWKDPSPTTP
jgi:hypothetical protein